jgi:tetratricopeptide (TPR) repeat protein
MNQQPENKAVRSGERRTVVGICVALALLVWIAFGQTIHYGFVNFDDDVYVYKNPQVAGGLTRSGAGWAFTHVHSSNWHPLTWLSHMLDAQLYGLNAGGHHATNVLIHAATVFLLFLLLRQMTGFLWRSAFVAAVFAIHPLRTESVAWVAERKDVLSGFFFVLTLIAYVWYARRAWSFRRYAVVALMLSCALMAKPVAVTIPFVLFLLDYWPLNRWTLSEGRSIQWRIIYEKIPLFALSGATCVITIVAQEQAVSPLPLIARIDNAVLSYIVYLRQMVYPSGLVVLYPFPESGLPLWKIVGAVALLFAISTCVVVARRKQPWLLFGWLWYLGMLVPMIGILQVGAQAHADRYTYLPQIGLYLALAWTVAELGIRWSRYRLLLSGTCAAVLALLVICTRHQVSYWQNSHTLWTRALAFTSENIIAQNNLGNALLDEGNVDEAILHFENARQIKPEDPKAAFNLGNALIQKGRLNDGIENLTQALQLKPDYAEAHINLASAFLKVDRVDDAIDHYQKALQILPNLATAWNDLGFARLQKGSVADAIACFRKAVELDPGQAVTRNNLGNALVQQGKIDEAIAHYQTALQLKPDYAEAHYNLGSALTQKGHMDEAVIEFQRALQLKPDYATAAYNIGVAFFHQGKTGEAADYFQKAILINPTYAEAHYNLGNALVQLGNVDEAISHFRQALQIEPGLYLTRNNLGYILLQTGKVDEAIDEFQQVLKTQPNYPDTHYNLGNALFQKGKLDEAIDQFQQTLRYQPKFAEAHYRLGTVLLQKGDETEALAHFQQALQLKPDFSEVLNDLAWELATAPEGSVRDGNKAVQFAMRANEIANGKDLDILDTVAAAYAEAHRFDEAVRTARQAIEFAHSSGQQERLVQLNGELELYKAGHPFHREAK